MKKKLFAHLLLLFLICSTITNAGLPVASTAADPVWYYIQVLGDKSDDRFNRVFTAEGTQVFGRAITVAASPAELNKQLWRFEQNGDSYIVFNKSNGKKLDIGYNSSKGISVAVLSDNPITGWQWLKSGDYYNIKATAAPSGGNASNIYAHQANNWDNRNYAIMFENSSYNGSANSRFQFVLYEDFTIEISTDDNPVWYFITSAKPEYPNKGITDVVDAALPDIQFSLETIAANRDEQLWKVVKKSASPDDDRYHFINKATGNLIQPRSVYNNYYRFTQHTNQPEQSNGWLTKYLGGGQFEIYGTEDDGIVRYLNASSKNQPHPDLLIDENTKSTAFAWILKKAGDFSAIDRLAQKEPRIYVKEKQVVVEGNNDYIIRNLQGIQVPGNTVLPDGIYLVTLHGKTVKLVVK
jgi:hypothetical protein